VNGLEGAVRSSRPVRIALANPLGGEIDGAWWPYTASLADELPGLIQALHRPLGEIVDININWSSTDGAPDLNGMSTSAISMPGWRDRHQRVMLVGGRRASAKLLVVPYLTRQDLGCMVLRRAAARPIPSGQRDSQVFQTADRVVRAAEAEVAAWADRMQYVTAAESPTAQG